MLSAPAKLPSAPRSVPSPRPASSKVAGTATTKTSAPFKAPQPLLLLDAAGLADGEATLARGLKLAEREALLTDALLGWFQADRFLDPNLGKEAEHGGFVQALARGRVHTHSTVVQIVEYLLPPHRPAPLLGRVAAIDDELAAGDEGGLVGSKEEHTVGDLFRLGHAPHWRHRQVGLPPLRRV